MQGPYVRTVSHMIMPLTPNDFLVVVGRMFCKEDEKTMVSKCSWSFAAAPGKHSRVYDNRQSSWEHHQ